MPPSAENKENPELPDSEEPNDEEISGFLPELLRRGLTLGFTGLFLTEEAMRKALGDKVPREWLEFIASQSERTRQELVERLSREFGRVLSALDPVELMRRIFEGQTLEVTARLHFPDSRKPESKEEVRSSGAGISLRSRDAEKADTE